MHRGQSITRTRARRDAHAAQQESGVTLPRAVRHDFETHFAHDFSHVRVHATDQAAADAEAMGAKAFTIRNHIYFGAGRFAPETREGERLLGHELAHVAQQSRRGGAPFVQCDDLDDVKKVRSLVVEEKEAQEQSAKAQLAKRLKKRRDDIEALLAGTKKPERKAELQQDLAKTVDEIAKSPDAKGISPALRKDVIESYEATKKWGTRVSEASKAFHKHDSVFADKDVVATLKQIDLKAADLKALIARESGDLTDDDQTGDIAGIAQMDAEEEKKAGGAKGDRKKPEKAIPLAAKVLVNKAAELKKRLKALPAGIDWKKFLFAAYNAGVYAIGAAQDEAISRKLGGKLWDELTAGDKTSPLFAGLKKFYTKTADKYSEVVNHVKGIFARLTPR